MTDQYSADWLSSIGDDSIVWYVCRYYYNPNYNDWLIFSNVVCIVWLCEANTRIWLCVKLTVMTIRYCDNFYWSNDVLFLLISVWRIIIRTIINPVWYSVFCDGDQYYAQWQYDQWKRR